MADDKSGKSSESAKKSSSNEVNIDRMSITEGSTSDIKGIDANRYATKKTVAQGLLDIALLTSNASQLKYILQVGSKHEFYTLLVTLITISIILQVLMGLVLLSLNLLHDCCFHKPRFRTSAININYLTTATAFLITVSAGIIALVITSLNGDAQKKIANWLYHISVGLMTGVIFCDVIKMNFGLDPALSEHDLFERPSIEKN